MTSILQNQVGKLVRVTTSFMVLNFVNWKKTELKTDNAYILINVKSAGDNYVRIYLLDFSTGDVIEYEKHTGLNFKTSNTTLSWADTRLSLIL